MDTELSQQIEMISHDIKETYGETYKKQFEYAVNTNQNIETTHIFVDLIELTLNDDFKQKQINTLKKEIVILKEDCKEFKNKIDAQNVRINELECENKIIKEENKIIKEENKDLKNKISEQNIRIFDLECENKDLRNENKELKIKIKKQDIKIRNLEDDNKKLIKENQEFRVAIQELKAENQELRDDIFELSKDRYNLILWQTYKNLEYYIIQKATKYDNDIMKNINTNLTEFMNDPNNYMYMNEINMLKNKFNIDTYSDKLWLMKRKRTEIAHPDPINLEQLKRACNKMKKEYEGIENLYDAYMEICDLFH
jgi:chromosome segregation ATPase